MFKTHEQKGGRQDMASVALRASRSCSYPTASESSALAFALRVGEADPTGAPKPRLLDPVRVASRARHYSRRTETAYVAWIRRYISFHDQRHPADPGAPDVTRFLSSLAVAGQVAASTQNQALSALLFLYGEVLFDEGATVFHESLSQTGQEPDQLLWRMAFHG